MNVKHFLLIIVSFHCFLAQAFDLTVVGNANKADGIGRISLGIIEILKDDLAINYVPCFEPPKLIDVDQEVRNILLTRAYVPGTVSILTNAVWHEKRDYYQLVPKSKIKIAYSMIESTKIPHQWVKILNEEFDAVAVPDRFLIDVYKSSGVRIPIYEIPHGMDIDEFLAAPLHMQSSDPFVFGSTVSFDPRKNHELLIRAFAKEFKNSNQVILRMNGRYGYLECERLKGIVKELNATNIFLTRRILNDVFYLSFMRSFDCFVNIAKGEGFSLCPRECLALGIPCILTDNTAQKTLCKSGYVRAVPSLITEPAVYNIFDGQELGYFFNCKESDVREALRDVYTNYRKHLKIAHKARDWVKRYSWKSLKYKYLNLVKPKKIILGKSNEVTDEYLMTNSPQLFKKYQEHITINECVVEPDFAIEEL